MRRVTINLQSRFGLLLSVLLPALSLSLPAGMGLATPSTLTMRNIPANLAEQQEEIPYCGLPPGECNKIQIVMMIDQSGSMPKNDTNGLRFSGAENLVDLLADRYLEALAVQSGMQGLVEQGLLGAEATQDITPTIQLAVLHFGSGVFSNHISGWINIDPKSEDAWAEQFEGLKPKFRPEDIKRGEATNFIRPFEEARKLLDQASPQDDQGCPQRVILLLTDGAPANAQVLKDKALKAHMDKVEAIAKESMSGMGYFIYVTAFNVRGDNYWGETEPYWFQITGDSGAADPRRSEKENTPEEVAIRVEKIIATHLGYRYQRFPLKARQEILLPSAYMQSMRITYFASAPPTATPVPPIEKFTLVDPDGHLVEPEGEDITLTGQDTPIQVMVIKSPKHGDYRLTSETGGAVTLLPTYQRLTPKVESPSGALQRFTNSDIKFSLLDGSGNPVTRVDYPKVQLDLQAVVHQGDQRLPLELSEDGSSFNAAFLPVSSDPAQVEVTAILRDAQGKKCKLTVEPTPEFEVAPVAFRVEEPSGKGCTPLQMPVTYPLTLVNANTHEPAVISVPITWEVSSTSMTSGQPVETSIDETGSGQYQLTLATDKAEDIRTSLTASAEVKGKEGKTSHPFFTRVLTTTGLLEGLSPTNLPLTSRIETSSNGLQQFTSSDIKLTLLDTTGNPVARADYPEYRLDLQAEVRQGDKTRPLSLSEDGNAFKATFLPVSSGKAQVEVVATLRDTQGRECNLPVEPGEMNVAPVAFEVGEPPGQVCIPSQMPVIYPLTLVNANTRAPAAISVPVAWEVSSSSMPSGQPVEASIDGTGAGQYQLILQTDKAGDIRTSLTASAKVDGQSYPIDKPYELLTTGLLEDRSLAFELGEPGRAADPLSLFFNRLFRPKIKNYSDHQILIGRRLFGWLGSQDVLIRGRFFDQRTGKIETGIQRFYVQLAPEDGGPMFEKSNRWMSDEDGIDTLLIPALRLGAYRVNVIDEGESVACTTIAGLPSLNLLLINDFWEYIFWIVLFLFAFLLLAWLILVLICRYLNPPWGYLQLVEPGPNGQVVWTGPFVSGDEEHAVRSCYTWELDPTDFFGIVKIKARSWDQPRHWIKIEVRRVDDVQVYKGYLGPRCTYICWEDRPWKDARNEKDFRLTWRKGTPAGK